MKRVPTVAEGSRCGGKRFGADSTKQREVRVSIVTAAFNAGRTLEACMQSVLRQDFPALEHIVIDAGSDDGTLELLRRYNDRVDCWISEPDSGIYDAWNKGVALANGEWIAFLGADDCYLSGAVSRYMQLADSDEGADFLCSKAQLIHSSGYSPVFGQSWQWPACARALTTINVGTMHRRLLFETYGPFDTSFASAGDYEFLLRAGPKLRSRFLPAVTVLMNAGGASETAANLYERRRAKLERGVRPRWLAAMDLAVDLFKFHVRRALLTCWGKMRAARSIRTSRYQ